MLNLARTLLNNPGLYEYKTRKYHQIYKMWSRYASISGDSVSEPSKTCNVDAKLLLDDKNIRWRPRRIFIHTLPFYYASAAKFRLTSMVLFTTIGGCMISPVPFDPYTICVMGISSFLISASANSINQFMEYPHDCQMNRTKSRVLPLSLISASHMLTFGICSGILGSLILAYYTNPITLLLATGNLLLYTTIYTPMKQISIYNTWIGSVVGAIPPLIGYTAMIGGCIDMNSLFLPLVLFFWQFPHFNSLSWLLRDSYAMAGIKMMVHYDVPLLTRVTMRYTLAIAIVSVLMPIVSNMTTSAFIWTSSIPNILMIYLSYKFQKCPNNKNSLTLFKMSLIHLFTIILLLIIHKTPLASSPQQISI